jgi:site-specific DNA recombinase
MITVAIYARVSSEKQAQDNTIASQISALENQVVEDGHTLLDEFKFIDNGYSGSNLIRPALEKLRDKVSAGEIDKIYIHSPDRLSRKYAYQMILLEEFQKAGTEISFLNCQISDSAESHLLLQMQGMIAEYERAKIMERNRRGKIHAAKSGRISVLAQAPFGYRYIDKYTGGGQAFFETNAKEAEIVRKIFFWIGQERLSIGAVHRKLNEIYPFTRKGKNYWCRSTVWSILKNPAYKGLAAFGRKKTIKQLPRIRPKKGSSEHPKRNFSVSSVGEENWIYIPVPAIIDEDIYNAVQRQLEENKKSARIGEKGTSFLLQGLIVCKQCDYAYYAKRLSSTPRKNKVYNYAYYRCGGTDAYRFGGKRLCSNTQIRMDTLDVAVWEEVKGLLKNPERLLKEYERRILELESSSLDQTNDSLEKQINRLKRGISKLIDSYTQEYIDKNEFEPRIKEMKQRLKLIEKEKNNILDQLKLKNELRLIVTDLEHFSSCVETKIEQIDWHTKRDIIRTLVKRIEINEEDVTVVFRLNELPPTKRPTGDYSGSLQHCPTGRNFIYGYHL